MARRRPPRTLPPWSGNDRAMYNWCIAMLEAQDWKETDRLWAIMNARSRDPAVHKQYLEWLESEEFAIKRAREGDPTLLRKRYPQLAEFLHPAKRPKGRPATRPVNRLMDDRAVALDYLKRIKKLWRTHYGRKKRIREDGITADEIVAEYMGIPLERLKNWGKRPVNSRIK